ncbi:glycosyl hydrolase [Streptomyces sp. CNQ-509]|uniref:glycoside hydrolase family 31 protein n=1 Tax=unclassified Streptomyces TaxID=2593676 RepID=UPI00062E03E2|nr:TIM-barrel domain-containing protein [Streptomyces sp. CNQ-509]AKH81076.1 glycosyl hydrolase [Streptomyces sp. CNQ-509]
MDPSALTRRARALRAAVRNRRADATALPRRRAERARVPGLATGAEAVPGGGVIRFARSALELRVTTTGAVFCGWDGAEPEPSYALARAPETDARVELEPDAAGGGWRVVSERVTVAVSRRGAVEVRTPAGVVLRREQPPRWWESPAGAPEEDVREEVRRWVQRAHVAPDARFFGLGGRAAGPSLPDGRYRLWNSDPGGAFAPGDDPLSLTMPVQFVVSDAGCHLLFHDNSWDGSVELHRGAEGGGSGHDRPGRVEMRMAGGPLRYWVMAGTPARVLQSWTALTGAPAVPPAWALGYQHARRDFGGAEGVRRVVRGYRERGLPLAAVHLDIDHYDGHRVFTSDPHRFPDLPRLARELAADGVRIVSVVDPGVKAEPGYPVYDAGVAADAFVRDARGRPVRGVVWPGDAVFPDFTDPRARKWWGGLYAERLQQGFTGFWHDMNEPASFTAFGEKTLPRSARHALEGRGGDHREAHNVYALQMARAAYGALTGLQPDRRPFLFSRSGWAGLQRYGGTWSGDVATGWPGLSASLALVIGLGLCGVPYSGPDIGGFSGRPDPELYLRWLQLGSYLPLFRTHCALGAGRREPWEFGPEVLEHAGAALRERKRLRPYLATLARLAERSGAPFVRPLWWYDPADRALRETEDAFLLGDALLVAPVLAAEARRRAVRLPLGLWYDTATGRALTGPGTVELEAPLARVPVLARAGAVLPVAGADGGTELEVWAPPPGATGGGVVVRDDGDGWEAPRLERYVTRWAGRTTVLREDGTEPDLPVRVRGE